MQTASTHYYHPTFFTRCFSLLLFCSSSPAWSAVQGFVTVACASTHAHTSSQIQTRSPGKLHLMHKHLKSSITHSRRQKDCVDTQCLHSGVSCCSPPFFSWGTALCQHSEQAWTSAPGLSVTLAKEDSYTICRVNQVNAQGSDFSPCKETYKDEVLFSFLVCI